MERPEAPFKNFDKTKFSISSEKSGAQRATDSPDNDVLEDTKEGDSADEDAAGDNDNGDANENADVDNTASVEEETATEEEEQEAGEEGETTEEEAGEEEEDTAEDDANQEEVPEDAYTEEDFLQDMRGFLDQTSEGKIKEPEQILAILKENEELKVKLLDHKPKFTSPAAEKAFEYSTKAAGMELPALSQYLHVQQLDLAKLSPKDKQLEAFVLTRPDISRGKAEIIFNAKYEEQFAEKEGNVVLEDAHDVATREAENKILGMQKEYSEAKTVQASAQNEQSEADTKALEQRFEAVVSDFAGITIKFGDSPADVVNVPMATEEVSDFKAMLVNPTKLLDRIMQKCTVDGKFNDQAYANVMYAALNVDRLITEARTNGLNSGKLKIVQERKNTVVPKKGNGAITSPNKKSFAKTMAEAVGNSNKR